MYYCGAFIDAGIIVPLHRFCEQADGAAYLQLARVHLYLMACSEAGVLWTSVLRAGDRVPAIIECHHTWGEGDRVPLLYNVKMLETLVGVPAVRADYFDDLPTSGNREMLRGIPLNIPTNCGGAARRSTGQDGERRHVHGGGTTFREATLAARLAASSDGGQGDSCKAVAFGR